MRGYEELMVMIEDINKRMYNEILDANRSGDEDELNRVLKKWNYDSNEEDNYVDVGRMKVLVLGKSETQREYLEDVIRSLGMDVGQFEFIIDYEHGFDFAILKNSLSYSDVIVGGMGHMQKGGGDSSSAIANMESHPDIYPHTVRCVTSAGELKMTKKSFYRAVKETKAFEYKQREMEL